MFTFNYFPVQIPNVPLEEMSELRRKHELSNLLTVVIENSRAIPFRWFANKFTCFFCRSRFDESSQLKVHMAEEHEDAKVTKILRSLLGSCRLKLDVSDVSCKLCPKRIEGFENFLEHATTVHKLTFNKEMRRGVLTFKLSDVMNCEECGAKFKFFGTFLKHTLKYHSSSSSFLCEICGQGFVAKKHVDYHVKTVHNDGQIDCPKCDKTFASKKAMKYHDEVAHRNPELKCTKCHEVFTSKYTRNRHLAIVHDVKTLQFRCDQCPQVFIKHGCLVEHKSRVHLKEKTVTCQVCGLKLFNDRALQLHMVKHSDARPFECEFCKKTFQRKTTLKMHRRIHTNDKRCVCKECGKAFVQTASLKLHLRVHHPGAEGR